MTKIYKVSSMIHGGLQADSMGTKHDGHIHNYGAPMLVALLYV